VKVNIPMAINNTPLETAEKEGGDNALKGSIDKSIRWFKDGLKEIQNERIDKPNLRRKREDSDPNKFVSPREIVPGSMYMFFYDPKTKDVLPYYDQFPLIFCIDVSAKGFTGLNLHYIRPTLRLKLFEALRTRTSNRNYDDDTKLLISYQTLRAASKYRFYRPCFKQYLKGHVISKIKLVHPSQWQNSLFLPNESFVGLRSSTVWKFSESMI
jgi:hypothetical protein